MRLKVMMFAICLAFVHAAGSPAASAQAWPNGYTNQRTITINHTKVPNTTQANFPVLISGIYADLATTAHGGTVTNANGYDIIFTSDAAGANVLPFEQESYSATTGQINYWVNIPSLSPTVDTVIFMFYGNSSVTTDQSNKAGVWSNGYGGVWHLPNGTTLTTNDSTGNGNNATNNNSATATTGEIGGGASLSASSSQYLSAPDSSSLKPTSITFSFWMKRSGNQQQYAFTIDKGSGATAPYGSYFFHLNDSGSDSSEGSIYVGTTNGIYNGVTYPSGSFSDGVWYYIAGSFNSSSKTFSAYKNGQFFGSSTASVGTISYDTTALSFGRQSSSGTYYFNGSLDEFRVSNVVRSSDWIATEYNNQSSPSTFFAMGAAANGASANPVITGLSAAYGTPISVTISGANFGTSQGTSTITSNGTPLTPTSWSATSIVAPIPFGIATVSATFVVTVSGTASNGVSFTAQPQALPSSWLDQDIGTTTIAGSAGFTGGVFTQTGAGATVGTSADSLNFAYQSLSGDGSITARLVSYAGGNSSNGVAGVMIRESLSPGAQDAYVNYSGGGGGDEFTWRSPTGAYAGGGNGSGCSLPCWMQLVRAGNLITGYGSQDGVNWTYLNSRTITMASTVYIGLDMDSDASGAATAKFDNVSITSSSVTPPVITSVSATTGAPGSQVVISGSGFGASQGNSVVTLNGTAMPINSWSNTSITITIPAGATSGELEVMLAPTMDVSNFVMFDVESNALPSPWLDQDVGTVGAQGSASYSSGLFTVTGAGTAVGGGPFAAAADSFHTVYQPLSGDGSIIARIDSTTGTLGYPVGAIMIRETMNPGATTVGFLHIGSGAVELNVRSSTGAAGGSNGGEPACSLPCWLQIVRSGNVFSAYYSTNGLNWTQAGSSVTVSMATNAYAGLAVNSSGTGQLSTSTFDTVTVVPGRTAPVAPSVSTISPVTGGFGTSVTINGVNFGATQGSSVVTFNGTNSTSITSWSNTQIVALVPTGATTGQVGVTVAGIPSVSNPNFTVYNPVITSITPPGAPIGATVTITGTGLSTVGAPTAALQFNGVNVVFWSNWTNNSITLTVPTTTSGPVTLQIGGATSAPVQFAVLEPLAVTSISPAIGPAGTSVTITGAGFGATQSNSTLSFYGAPATSITSWSDTQIVAIAPTGAMSGQVNVTLAGNTVYGPAFTQTTSAIVTDSLGNSSTYIATLIGGQWNLTNAQGSGCSTCSTRGTIQNTFDSNSNMLTTTDELGHTTTNTFDSNSNVLSTSQPLTGSSNATTSYTYNSFGEVLTATDPLGNVTTNTYDGNGNLLTVTSPAPASGVAASVTHFAYNSLGELTQITDPLGHISTMTYTTAGLIATITDAQSNVTTYAYDAHGNRTSVTDAQGNVTTFAYDAGDRLITITYPPAQSGGSSTTSTFTYDSRGRRTSATDQNAKTTSYAYDTADRLTTVTDAASNVTTYSYDTENNLLGITDANSHTTNFTYDAFGRVTQTTFPSSFYESYAYDAIGNLTSKTDRKGQTIQYVYDALNRLTQKSYPDSTSAVYTYDLASRIQQVNDPTGTYAFAYDNMGRLIGTTTNYSFLSGTTFTNAYTYDANSNRTGYTAPDGSTNTYTYDTLNRLTTLANSWAGSFGFTYDTLSRRTQMTRPNGVNTNYTYDSLSRLLSVLHQNGASTIDGASYTVDATGNRTSKTDQLASVTSNYSYDALYELTQVTQAATTTESYTYDPVGNRLSSLTAAASSYNVSNELTSNSNATYTYDNDGNTTSKTDSTGTTGYNWDFQNRLTSVTLPGSGGTASFKYDPFGRRIQKAFTQGGNLATTNYVYDGVNVAEQTDGAGNLAVRFVLSQGIDEPLAVSQGAATNFYNSDGLHSVTSVTNSTGGLATNYTYDSFGNLLATAGSVANSTKYTAREFDAETGLYYYRARYFDPVNGRFLGEDMFPGNGDGSLYAYVRNNPLNFLDPSGMVPQPACECKGSTGGIRVAEKCCRNAAPMTPDEGAPPYDPCFSYMFVNANFMYRHGGGSAWGRVVRGCLKCAYQYGTSSSDAHGFCYVEGDRRTDSWWGALTPVTMLAESYGFLRAVAGASAGMIDQTAEYAWYRGKRPFTCLNVK